VIVAHGIGDASALPVPLGIALLVVAACVAGWSEVAARRAASGPPPPGGVPLPRVTALVDAGATRLALRVFGVLSLAGLLLLGAAGPPDAAANALPRMLLVVIWGGLVPLSLLAPGAWRALDPLRLASSLLARLTGDPDEETVRPPSPRLGRWPAAGLAAVVAAAEAVRPPPSVVLGLLGAAILVLVGGAVLAGRTWHTAANPFDAVSAVAGRLSPFGRDESGRVVLGGTSRRLSAPVAPGMPAVAAVLIGSSLADFARDTAAGRAVLGTSVAGVLASVVLGIAVAAVFVRAAASVRVLAPAVLPIALGYFVAHLFAPVLVEGQVAAGQLLAALREGPGVRAALVADYTILPATAAALLQLTGFLVPHLVAAQVAARLAVGRYGPANAGRALLGFRVLLVVSAVAGTALRYAAA